MSASIEREALATYARFVALRDEIDLGAKPWSLLADFFADAAAYIDPAWGRVEGREAIRRFFEESMAGLTGAFQMPPHHPNRDVSLPEAWAHLEASPARRTTSPA